MKSDLRYTPSDCFETFPLPPGSAEAESRLQQVGELYDRSRQALTHERGIGLTTLYNLVHDPSEQDSDIDALRGLQADIDEAALRAYGWTEIDTGHDFHEVDYLPESDRTRFTVSPSARLEILDRLTELNRERYLEEQGREEEDDAATTARSASTATVRAARRSRREDSQQADLFEADEELPPRRKIAEESSSPTAPDSPTERLRSWFGSHDGWHARGDAVEALELSEGQWRSAINELLDAGAVERKGRKRGTRYRAVRDYKPESDNS